MTSRPLPAPDALSAPFFEGLAKGRLLIQTCRTCGAHQLGSERCLRCRSEDLDWTTAEGRGRIHAATIMHTVFHPAFAGEVPYAVALVELDEGPRLLGGLRGVAADEALVGRRVRTVIAEIAPNAYAPVFEPVQED